GLDRLNEVIAGLGGHPGLETYYTQNISYPFSEDKRAGLQLFLKYLREMERASQQMPVQVEAGNR
ncbi:MAG: hypothetical protein MUF29_07650, partial [Chitinophagaceae bacterium]|nr:hypothetical protein [Chitinophagaceae bacterium]